ncbi:MAG TPA: DUF2269 domain-containing protein [Pseudonocardiaceae bacterium]
MTMRPAVRTFALTVHVCCSVGWLGAVGVFVALAVVGLTGQDRTARAAYLVMEPLTWAVLVPLAFASLLTGVIQALGTTWGLFRHYWVLVKLLLTVVATVVLLLYTRTVGVLADVAAAPGSDVRGLGFSPLLHSGAALVVLLVATVLATYKPRGRTGFGRRRRPG